MAGSIEGPKAKLDWARKHAEMLKAETAGPLPHVPWANYYPVTHEMQPNGREYRFYVDAPPLDSNRYALIAGDCFFNLRAALDQLVYELHVRRYRGNVPDDVAEKTMFPILDKPRLYRGRRIPTDRWNDIHNLSAVQRRAIEWLQPYNRRNDNLARTRDWLSVVNDLNRKDKHRRLHVVLSQTIAVSVPHIPDPELGFRHESFFVPLEGKTEVFRWTFKVVPLPALIANEININDEITAGISLNEGSEQALLLPLLEAGINAVETVFARFARFLA